MPLPKKGTLMYLVTELETKNDLDFVLPEDYLVASLDDRHSVRVYFGGDVTSWVKKNQNRVFTIKDWAGDEWKIRTGTRVGVVLDIGDASKDRKAHSKTNHAVIVGYKMGKRDPRMFASHPVLRCRPALNPIEKKLVLSGSATYICSKEFDRDSEWLDAKGKYKRANWHCLRLSDGTYSWHRFIAIDIVGFTKEAQANKPYAIHGYIGHRRITWVWCDDAQDDYEKYGPNGKKQRIADQGVRHRWRGPTSEWAGPNYCESAAEIFKPNDSVPGSYLLSVQYLLDVYLYYVICNGGRR